MLSLILSSEYLQIAEPPSYEENTIRGIIDDAHLQYETDPNFKPNIIFVMSEAFWDPTLMSNISFSRDPIPFFHSLQQSRISGTVVSPVFGGGTANTELEVLTGFSTQFLPSGVVPYAQYIHRPLEALPAILKRQGYTASAVHTYDNWFYNRSSVYKYFGFDCFISKEFISNPEYKGEYIRDTELTRLILDKVKETDEPDFIYAISMQNHGPYSGKKNPDNTVQAGCDTLDPDSLAILNNYINTLADVDRSLQQLIQGLRQIDEPTLVIFFGDHLPLLGSDYGVYKKAGFIQGDGSYQDYLNLHSVPFVTWDNYSISKQQYRLSANFLGALALKLTQKEGSPLTDFLSGLMEDGSAVVTNPDFTNREKLSSAQIKEYKLLQHDLLFGREYAYNAKPANRPAANEGYVNGSGPLIITSAELVQDGVLIKGKNFAESDIVCINGKQAVTDYIDDHNLRAGLPDNPLEQNQWIEIQVKLMDSQKNLIAKSNIYSFYQTGKGAVLDG